jgi:serine/threonine-protein kinase
MLAGEPPFKGDTPFEVALQHVQAEPRLLKEIRPDLPPDLCAIVEKMMAKQPDQRYQTGRELLKDLTRLRNSLTEPMKRLESGSLGLGSSGAEQVVAGDAMTLALPAPKRSWLPWAVGASIILALGVGAALGWMRNRPADMQTVTDNLLTSKRPAQDIDPKKEKESLLVKMAQEFADPGGDRGKVHLGLVHRVELASFYLDERRFADADRFFNELMSIPPRKVPAYNLLGKLGHAIVLGFQDKAAESNKLFLEIFNEKWPQMYKGAISLVNTYPDLKKKIAEALDRNEANKEKVPDSLQDLRRPGPINPPPFKPGGKKTAGQ